MRGLGSGPTRRHSGTVDEATRLDVFELQKAGALRTGTTGTMTWGRSTARFRATVDRITLEYRMQVSHVSVDVPIPIERQPCTFGGSRPLFYCPECQRRCRYLYWRHAGFSCRVCADLTYASRRASRNPQALARLYGVGLFDDCEAIRRLRYRLCRASNPRRIAALRRRLDRLEALRASDCDTLIQRFLRTS